MRKGSMAHRWLLGIIGTWILIGSMFLVAAIGHEGVVDAQIVLVTGLGWGIADSIIALSYYLVTDR